MKALTLFLILILTILMQLSAQNPIKRKADSTEIVPNAVPYKPFDDSLKLLNPFGRERHLKMMPNSGFFRLNPNMAMIPTPRPPFRRAPGTRMPVMVPQFQSKMPVLKPDSTIHYFIKIKKF